MIDGSPRILIIRLSSIGDVVRALSVAHMIREAYPRARIDWAVERKAADIVEGHHALDQVWVYARPTRLSKAIGDFLAFCRQVRRNRYDVVLDLHGVFKSGLISAMSGARDRYAFARPRGQEGSHLFANHKVQLPTGPLNRVEENLLLCEAIAPRSARLDMTIYVPPEVQEQVNHFYEETFAGGKRVVAMHVPVEREEKRWPATHFAALADMLLSDGRFEVLVTWGPGQFDTVQEVLASMRRRPVVAPETPDLKHYAWLIHLADLYFGCDTGPMHIAAAMGTPVVAVFAATDPAQHEPYKHPCILLKVGPHESAVTPEMAYDACLRMTLRRESKQ
jgi:lipopolysaccharide heptosyltransferase I